MKATAPFAMAAGLATLELVSEPDFYLQLAAKTAHLARGLQQRAKAAGIDLYVPHIGGMFGLFFTDNKNITCEGDVQRCNLTLFKRFFHSMLNEGIYFAPSAYEIGFMSSAHGMKEIEKTLEVAEKVFASLNQPACEELLQPI